MKRINRLKVVPVEQNKTGKWLADGIHKTVNDPEGGNE
jgi:hypothetical protein